MKQVADACRQRGIPIRIGVNSGSLDHNVAARYGVTPEALVESHDGHGDGLVHGFQPFLHLVGQGDKVDFRPAAGGAAHQLRALLAHSRGAVMDKEVL